MNLAVKDTLHNFGRFVLTTMGVGLLLMIAMGMRGVLRGSEGSRWDHGREKKNS